MPDHILDTGISVAYEPEDCSPLVDIVIVHGLHGHPYKTWIYKKDPKDPGSIPSGRLDELSDDSGSKKQKKNSLYRFLPLFRSRKPSEDTDTKHKPPEIPTNDIDLQRSSCVFWPKDLLPAECPKARVLVFGYDSKVTKYTSGATNQNNVHSHSKDLLFALARERPLGRRLIFVAHSLGGIVVKEMLAISSAWSSSNFEAKYQDVVRSTSAVVFLGTPHRGSPDLVAFGQWARSLVSSLRMQTTSEILDTLGLKNSDLQRAQEAFSALWQRYDFRVKTFQEGLGLKGINLGVLGNKVVPDYSSILGDYRECAETLQANHSNLCRFSGRDDPNYRKVGGEIRSIYLSIGEFDLRHMNGHPTTVLADNLRTAGPQSSLPNVPQHLVDEELTDAEKQCLKSLWFPRIHSRYQNLETPTENTCNWLFDHRSYQNWLHYREQEEHNGLLWLTGKPGAGKSVLMKEALRRTSARQSSTELKPLTAAFFFDAKGTEMQRSCIGLFRSLLYQLLPRLRPSLRQLSEIWAEKTLGHAGETDLHEWEVPELRIFFKSLFTAEFPLKMIIFIDALDECSDNDGFDPPVYFWQQVTKHAQQLGSQLHVCISSRNISPRIVISGYRRVIVEHHNEDDIATYVKQKLSSNDQRQEERWEELRQAILEKSAGVFLWVVLVVNKVLRMWDEGLHPRYILLQLRTVPKTLKSLFTHLLWSDLKRDTSITLAINLFRWALLATRPLRLHEWHHILAFCKEPGLTSLKKWRESNNFTEDDEQLERQIQTISKGLLQVSGRPGGPQNDNESSSVRAGAGSLDLETGETRVIEVIHQSVHDFFVNDDGFKILHQIASPFSKYSFDMLVEQPELAEKTEVIAKHLGEGHLSIMNMALDYIGIRELDALVIARMKAYLEAGECFGPEDAQSPGSSTLASWGWEDNAIEGASASAPDLSTQKRNLSTRIDLSQVPDMSIDVSKWVDENETQIDRMSDHSTECYSIRTSASVRTQTLDDYPALLVYATSEFFKHAHLARKYGADPSYIRKRLVAESRWDRLNFLSEDKSWLLQHSDLLSWLLTGKEVHVEGVKTMNRNSNTEINSKDGQGSDKIKAKSKQKKPIRRRGSLASFSSASSFSSTSSYQ